MSEWIISSSALILIVLLLRRILRGRISLRLQYALWGIVLLRLLIPFTVFESSFSLMNVLDNTSGFKLAQAAEELGSFEDIEFVPDIDVIPAPGSDVTITSSTGTVSGYYGGDSDHHFPTTVMTQTTEKDFQLLERAAKARDVLIPIWLIGAASMLGFFTFCNLRFSRTLIRSRRLIYVPGSIIPVYVSAAVETPCLFGFFRPCIYVTPDCEGDNLTLRHVLAHESTHYRHGDNIWSALRCVALALHWYNPLVWYAAVVSKRDAELSCDEGAINRLGEDERAPYGRTLIGLTCTHGGLGTITLAATTMTGSSKSIKERITLIAKKPRMAFYTLVAVLLIAAVAVLCTFSGSDSGFTDREARKAAKPLADSVAFVNYYELDGRPEILRYEGGPAEADPDVNKQYVRVSYPTKNSLRQVVVEFCMTDEKGQHYDEPFSASSYLSHTFTQIVPCSADTVSEVEIWRRGGEAPIIPATRIEEVKEYIPHFFHGDVLPADFVPDFSANTCGFTVLLTDGSSVTFGLDYVEQNGVYYNVVAPELPQWLTKLLEGDVTTPTKNVSIADDIAHMDADMLSRALDIVHAEIDHYADCGVPIVEAWLTDLELIPTDSMDEDGSGVAMYRVEYRLLPEDIGNVVLAGGMKIEDGWITEWGSPGQPYIMYYMQNGLFAGLSANTHTLSMQESYSGEYSHDSYADMYTAACIEFLDRCEGAFYLVMMQTGGVGIPPYYHLKYERTWTENGWLNADGKKFELSDVTYPRVSISDEPNMLADYTELAFYCNPLVTMGKMEVYTEAGELLRLAVEDVDDLYLLDPGSYYVVFDITVPGRYIAEEDMREETCYTCAFPLDVTPTPLNVFYFTGDTDSLVELYAREIHAKEMFAVEGDYAITDYKLVACDTYAQHVSGNIIIGEMHYAISPVNWDFPDWWAGGGMEEGEGEYEGMWIRHNQFTLLYRGNGWWECTGLATGGAGGWGFIHNHTADEALAITLDFLESGAVDTSLILKYLPLIDFADMDTEDFFTLMDEVENICVGKGIIYGPEEWRTWNYVYPDDQFYRNMYCMKAALNTDGAYSARMQYILNKIRVHDEELFSDCLQHFTPEEQDRLIMLADDDLV